MGINRILIANRGEIAVRIMRTARRMGIATVAIRTHYEPAAMYLDYADIIHDSSDEVREIPVFLDIEKLISIALAEKCDAVHPGYGFLAENAYFAQKCAENGLVFIGPSPDSIYKMGNKTVARQIASKAGIPMATGSTENVSHEEDAVRLADAIGYPVIIKAASGGGGKGMRIVRHAADMEKAFILASREAGKAFNDPSVFIEKYIDNPKHIEFQILGDSYGNIIHLGERECSIQRKHQKLSEEAPSPALSSELRERMGALAVRIARAVNYRSAGTVEFLLDSGNNFYFMEMNTRIQVEHTITEEITGTDIVEWQIRIANGEAIPFSQEHIRIQGWAIECRINAEDVQAGFAPDPGRISMIILPSDSHVRVDTGVKAGSVIVPEFDSMIAKLIVTGTDRKSAIRNLRQALDKVWIKGCKTTLPFFRMLVRNRQFISGDYTTTFLENDVSRYHYSSDYEEKIAAWLAVRLFLEENFNSQDNGKVHDAATTMSPWLMNKRLKQF